MVRLKQALLVAEDEEIAIELKPLLTGLGFKVTMLHDGALVTETLGDRQFEVAVVNANLPQMNWHRTAQEIKRASKTTTVIMMTRFAQEKDVRLALSAGLCLERRQPARENPASARQVCPRLGSQRIPFRPAVQPARQGRALSPRWRILLQLFPANEYRTNGRLGLPHHGHLSLADFRAHRKRAQSRPKHGQRCG